MAHYFFYKVCAIVFLNDFFDLNVLLVVLQKIIIMETAVISKKEKQAKALTFHKGLYESKINKQAQMQEDVKTPEYQAIIENLKKLNHTNVSI